VAQVIAAISPLIAPLKQGMPKISRRMCSMAHLSEEIAEYERLQAGLEAQHLGKWVVVHDRRLEGIFDSFDAAAGSAVERFGRGPYLIRQIGAPPVTLPASVMYRPVYA
jgi:hypothetical protein